MRRLALPLWTALAFVGAGARAGAQEPVPTPPPVQPPAPPTGAPVVPTGRPLATVDEPTVVVRRLTGDSVVLGSSALGALFRYDVKATVAGRPAAFAGVSLQDVLQAAGVPLDSLGGARMAEVVLVEGADGYRVAFTLAELAPAVGRRTALVADRRDGQPLAPNDGPLRLVVPDDARATRWVRQLRSLTVRSAAPAPPTP